MIWRFELAPVVLADYVPLGADFVAVLKDGSRLVCALNTRPEPISVPVVVEGTVGKVWNGRYVDGKLEIAANDGCMFEVK